MLDNEDNDYVAEKDDVPDNEDNDEIHLVIEPTESPVNNEKIHQESETQFEKNKERDDDDICIQRIIF